ncbi:tripartite motif-containing protein 3-like [Lingula anatina]|uniref:Tripartite motif-containing protein 3-like n=1 Tax=Lingula anatina TaxID=7574 RepID=A0A1S3HWL0_LINAN|nr:tripartite motif-containing protein 3-like [Lingula anatina]|eukprot:XP_013390403.1 tripartite motif-containing protein 3-like [Lingula anatina]
MAEALAAAFTDNPLTCNICLGEHEDPRVLPCYHTFCYGCISKYAKETLTPNRAFLCPICREEIQFPAGGLKQLKKNFVFSKAKDIITQKQDRRTLEEKQANEHVAVAQAIAKMAISCEKHANNRLKYYCEDDDTVICGECIATEHGGHRISSVEQVAKSSRDKIKAALVKTMKTSRFKESVAMKTTNETEDSDIRIATIKNIRKQAQSMRKFIDQREETLISEVNSHYDNRKKQEANRGNLELHSASLHSACYFAQELITNGTDSDIMVHAKSLIERLAVMEKTPAPFLDTAAEISYNPA